MGDRVWRINDLSAQETPDSVHKTSNSPIKYKSVSSALCNVTNEVCRRLWSAVLWLSQCLTFVGYLTLPPLLYSLPPLPPTLSRSVNAPLVSELSNWSLRIRRPVSKFWTYSRSVKKKSNNQSARFSLGLMRSPEQLCQRRKAERKWKKDKAHVSFAVLKTCWKDYQTTVKPGRKKFPYRCFK